MPIAFYMDVHIPIAITEQLRRRGVDVLTAVEDATEAAKHAKGGKRIFYRSSRRKQRAESFTIYDLRSTIDDFRKKRLRRDASPYL